MKRTVLTALFFAGCAAPETTTRVYYPLAPEGVEALYVCCTDNGCEGMEKASTCPPGGILYSCEHGETTTVNGKPYVVCHD